MSESIGVGIAGFPFETSSDFFKWVELCEAGDVDSIWTSDRLVSEAMNLEPLALMAVLAGATDRLQFGMNVVVLPFRDPLILAKQCATIDFLSDGRLIPAFGVGSVAIPEWSATGRSPQGRGKQVDEMLEIMTLLWQGEHVTYEGNYYQYSNARISPVPIRQPLPLWIGGSSKAAIRRTVGLGNGWLAGIQSPAQIKPVVAAIKAEGLRINRPLDDDHYGAGIGFRFGSWDEPVVQDQVARLDRFPELDSARSYLAVGNAEEILETLASYREAGISKFVLRPIGTSSADIMNQTEKLINEVIPAVHQK
jgi:probable F420-dependent oxidoreductase